MQSCMKCQNLFADNKKNNNLSSAEFANTVVKVKCFVFAKSAVRVL